MKSDDSDNNDLDKNVMVTIPKGWTVRQIKTGDPEPPVNPVDPQKES